MPGGAWAQASPTNYFVIEAEDFNYGSGQTLPAASVMPYYGGAYAGKANATLGIDFNRSPDGSSAEYRADNRVPMNSNPDLDRTAWTVTQNYKMGWFGGGADWFNYTRTIPAGKYRIYAALSYGDRSDNACRGSLDRVTSPASAANQTLQPIGTFSGPGTGGWGLNGLVPMKDGGGQPAVADLSGTVTLRFTVGSGDFDYLKLVRAQKPVIGTQPADISVMEGRPALLSLTLGSEDPAAFQWQTNQVNVTGANGNTLSIIPTLAQNGMKVRCILTNELGSTTSQVATVTVTPDTEKPRLVKVFNLGSGTVRVVFDENVRKPVGVASSAFTLTPGTVVNSISQGTDKRILDLTVSPPLAMGTLYTLKANGIQDMASAPNTIVANTTVDFIAMELAPESVGAPETGATLTRLDGGFDLSGPGGDIGGTSDSFQFAWQKRTGNFDLRVRVASMTVSHPFALAGLMAREALGTNARFAGVFASSAQVGCLFKSRDTTNGTATTLSPPGGFPLNNPYTWLRLRRVGGQLTGFAGYDGENWLQLGTTTLANPPTDLMVGLAAASQDPATPVAAQLRAFGATSGTGVLPGVVDRERLGPSSRRTGLVFSEILYHPKPAAGVTNSLEFIEIYNAGAIFEEMTGYEIRGGIHYRFPDAFRLQAGEFVVIAADPGALKATAGIQDVLGPWDGALNNSGDTLRLHDAAGALRLEVTYDSRPPWPVAAAGAGHSLVLSSPSRGESDPRAWSASEWMGGNPGGPNPYIPSPNSAVVINEFLSHTDDPQLDFIELYNPSNLPADLGGCVLTDDASTNRFRFPVGTTLAPRAFVSLDQNQLGFRLNAAGESLFLINAAGTRVIDALRYQDQENGVSSGRSPDGSSTIRRLASPTPGAANAPWKIEDVVINEVMYNPISGNDDDEFVELFNRTSKTVSLSGWELDDGIRFKFPSTAVIPPRSYLVIAKNLARLRSYSPQLNDTNSLGDYSSTLSNGGERLVLTRPDEIVSTNTLGEISTNQIHIVVSEVSYGTGGRWGEWSDGGGSSLELVDPDADLLQASNWADSDETAKAAWTQVTFTGPLDNGFGGINPDRIQILLLGAGECLVDSIELTKSGGANLVSNAGFESGDTGWSFMGNHSLSTVDTTGAFSGSRCLHVRAQGDGDTGVNSIRRDIAAGLTAGDTATLKARVRWLRGWPELLIRVKGQWLELPARLTVPSNLGTPGLANSRRVSNAGPAIYEVSHSPALPQAGQGALVTCRASDPQGIGSVTLGYRVDPATTIQTLPMTDNGLGGDRVAGDGIFSATIPAQAPGTLIAFHIRASDRATPAATNVFPALPPARECLVRWGDPIPSGTFGHYHLFNTAEADTARGQSTALNNTWRDATLVYGMNRVIYNAGFRDKGSPFHGGAGDYAVTVPVDDLLLGVKDRVLGSTGNGGEESSGMRSRVSAWIAREMGVPYLHAHYVLVYRNGAQHRLISEDLEQPNNSYAEDYFPSGEKGELFKIAVWFEFADDNSGFSAAGATLELFNTGNPAQPDLGRYRFNWQIRADTSANAFDNFFGLVKAVNLSGDAVPGTLAIADVDEWMRVFAYHRVLGNWDSYSFSVGQNMYLYRQPGAKWVLLPWDIDFVLGLGNGPTDALWGGQDPVINARFYDNPTFRRMLWRSFQKATSGPMQPSRYTPVIEAYRNILARNNITGLDPGNDIAPYIDQRRAFIEAQFAANNTPSFAITSSGGNNFSTSASSTVIAGTAPFGVASIEVNGTPYPTTWSGFGTFSVRIPLANGPNLLSLVGLDPQGNPVPGAADTITITFTGTPPNPRDYLAISEIHYNPLEPDASFLELLNTHASVPFDLSGFRLDGIAYTFPEGSILGPNSYLVLAKSRVGIALAYGGGVSVFDEFPGSLDNGGEWLRLVKPGSTPAEDVVIDDVRYDNQLPWPAAADGLGASLQLVDATKDNLRVGNWASTAATDPNRVTPGRTNSVRLSLAAFPLLWINEVLTSNASGVSDNMGEREPFIELYNSGTNTLDLSALYLTDSPTNLTSWKFPAGTSLAAKSFLVVWADGETAESVPGAPHTSFRLDPATGFVGLARLQGSASKPALMDYITCARLSPDRSFGSHPDGEPRNRRLFYNATPGATNDPAFPPVLLSINEFMAVNNSTLTDPADGKFSDWFEIHNAGSQPVDLSSYRLTDNPSNTTQFIIPPGYQVPAKGFLLVWADDDTRQNQSTNVDLHVNFKLAEMGESIGLYAPDGRLIDLVTFGQQTNDVAFGRFPDGTGPIVRLSTPTPRHGNQLDGVNLPPQIPALPPQSVPELSEFRLQIGATDPNPGQTLSYTLASGAPAGLSIHGSTGEILWTPSEEQGPGTYFVTIRVTDDGSPVLSSEAELQVNVTEVNSNPTLTPVADATVELGTRFTFIAHASDPDVPVQGLRFRMGAGSPLGAGINPDSGAFSWAPTSEQLGTHLVTVEAFDDGIPPRFGASQFSVTVKKRQNVPPPLVAFTVTAGSELKLRWSSLEGAIYRVEETLVLPGGTWTPLGSVMATGPVTEFDAIPMLKSGQRYFRIVVE